MSKSDSAHLIQSADKPIECFAQVNRLCVTEHQHLQRLDNFLMARLKGLPKSHIYNLIRKDEVRVNKKRCRPDVKLKQGDVVRIAPVRLAASQPATLDEGFGSSLRQRVAYEDKGLLVINKPPGLAVHGGSGQSLGLIEALRLAKKANHLELIHRIDKDTSGLLMVAKKRATLRTLQAHLRHKRIQKTYICLVQGHLALDTQVVDAALLRTQINQEKRVKVATHSDAKASQTHVQVLSRCKLDGQPISVVQAKPLTGRTHQIRVHMAHLGHPILGDDKYHPTDTSPVRRLCLHAWQLQIPEYPNMVAKLPKDMACWLPTTDSLSL